MRSQNGEFVLIEGTKPNGLTKISEAKQAEISGQSRVGKTKRFKIKRRMSLKFKRKRFMFNVIGAAQNAVNQIGERKNYGPNQNRKIYCN